MGISRTRTTPGEEGWVLGALRNHRSISVVAIYLPSWIPGMSFKDEMTVARSYSEQYLNLPFQYAIQKVSSGTAGASMVHDTFQHMEEKGIKPDEAWMKELKEASGTAFFAAPESPSSVLMTAILMMVVNPAVQERAQAQIDAVIGRDRLPTLDDRPSLPFIDAIYWEAPGTIRSLLSFPHVTSEDDMYSGFYIPKGAMFLTNLWSMSRDESKFLNAHEFMPERFLGDDGSLKSNDIDHIAFGFGRRSCPGKHFVDASLWGVIAKILAVFKFLKPLNGNGVEVPVEPKFSNGISLRPLPFKCRVVPRLAEMDADKLEQLIAASNS